MDSETTLKGFWAYLSYDKDLILLEPPRSQSGLEESFNELVYNSKDEFKNLEPGFYQVSITFSKQYCWGAGAYEYDSALSDFQYLGAFIGHIPKPSPPKEELNEEPALSLFTLDDTDA